MIVLAGRPGPLMDHLSQRIVPVCRVSPEPTAHPLTGGTALEMGTLLASVGTPLEGATAVVFIACQGATGARDARLAELRDALTLAERCAIPLILVSSLGTVAGNRRADVRVAEDAPHCEGGGLSMLADLVCVEREARAFAGRRGIALCVVRVPLLLGPEDAQGTTARTLLRTLARPGIDRLGGGVHVGDVRDAADGIARIAELAERRPIYHLPGTAVGIGELQAVAREMGVLPPPAPPRLWRLGRGTPASPLQAGLLAAMTLHWGARSLYAAEELGYRPRALRQTFADLGPHAFAADDRP